MRKRRVLAVVLLGTVAFLVAQEVFVARGRIGASTGAGMEPNIGIVPNNRAAVSKVLNTLLSDEYILLVKTKNYHWNVTGMNFNDLHLFFDKQYEQLVTIADEVAERVRMLGGRPLATLSEFAKSARLKETEGVVPEAREMIGNLLADHEAIVRSLRLDIDTAINEYGDAGTSNFLTDLIEKHEKMAWMLRSYIS